MKPIDPERLTKLSGSMREAQRLLTEIGSLTMGEFLVDRHRQSSAKYNFIVAIEAAIDIANHLISKHGFRAPEDYADTFRVLAEAGVLEREFARELEKMARFRNRLVHLYWEVDSREIWSILQNRLRDFEKYLTQIGTYLREIQEK